MPKHEISQFWALRSLAVSAVAVGIGFGLCGAGVSIPHAGILGLVSTIGLAVFSLGWIGILVSLIAMIVIWIINRLRT